MRRLIIVTILLTILAAPAAFARNGAAAPAGAGENAAYVYRADHQIPATGAAQHRTDGQTLRLVQTSAAPSEKVTLVVSRGGGSPHGGKGSMHHGMGSLHRGGGSFHGHGGQHGHLGRGHSFGYPHRGYYGHDSFRGRSYFDGGFGHYPYGGYYYYPHRYYAYPYNHYPYRYYPYGHYSYPYFYNYGTPWYFYFSW